MNTAENYDAHERFALGFVFILLSFLISTIIVSVVWLQNPIFATIHQPGISELQVSNATNAEGNAKSKAPTKKQSANYGVYTYSTEAAPQEPMALAPQAIVQTQEVNTRIDNGVVKFFFASGKADLPAQAEQALALIVEGAQEEGKQVQISGFHDASGNLAQNQALAKQRAQAVQAQLVKLGVDSKAIALHKPSQTLADGDKAEARRVEVRLLDLADLDPPLPQTSANPSKP
ncbi:MAG: OmpA family protein [Comamonas sp.]|nr:OmpA family protein [Comamonas sp.]